MKYSIVIPQYVPARAAITWLYTNVEPLDWTVEAADRGLQFNFKNESDAVWFALIHNK